MASGKTEFSEVARQRIWEESVGREMKSVAREEARLSGASPDFAPDLRRLVPVAAKIGQERMPTEADLENFREMKAKLAGLNRGPKEKNRRPATASQEVGWFADEGNGMQDERLPKKACEETKFAARYFELEHAGVHQRGAGR